MQFYVVEKQVLLNIMGKNFVYARDSSNILLFFKKLLVIKSMINSDICCFSLSFLFSVSCIGKIKEHDTSLRILVPCKMFMFKCFDLLMSFQWKANNNSSNRSF